MSPEPESTLIAAGTGAFPTTQWSVVLHVGAESESKVRAALETLCRQYWYPLYVFVRRQGRSHHEAEDCTQEFLAGLLAHASLAHARPERGRFRTFLLTALRHFLTDEWRRTQTAKRGGGRIIQSLDLDHADARFTAEPADPALTPEQVFDRNWARGLMEATMAGLQAEYQLSGRGALFAALEPLVWSSPGEGTQAETARQLGMNTHALTVALQRLRRRVGERLRSAVAQTVANPSDVDIELRHLIAALGGSTAGR